MATFNFVNISNFKKSISKTEKKCLKWQVKKKYIKNLFQEIKMPPDESNNEKLPIALFEEIEAELQDLLLLNTEESDDRDGRIDFIKNVVNTVKSEFDGVLEEGERKDFIHILTKIFVTLLSVKIENIEQTVNLIKLSVSKVLKNGQDKIKSKTSKNKTLAA